MKKGSVKAELGDELKTGLEIGNVGNSGSSIQPHLHVQVMNNENIFPLFGNLVPFKIIRGQRKSGSYTNEITNFSLVSGEHYIFG